MKPKSETTWGVSQVTGLPVILCPPDAPARSMTMEELQAVIDASQLEEDLLRAGIIVLPSKKSERRSQ